MGNITNSISSNVNAIDNIKNSMDILKQWSNMNTYNIIFDSDIDGDGWNNSVLCQKVIGKSNLYFIMFADNNNIFGGYIGDIINRSDTYVYSNNVFVFSLVYNGKLKYKKYGLGQQSENYAFWIYRQGPHGILYQFGSDILVYRIGKKSECRRNHFCYNNERNPLMYFNKFDVQRIIVVQMT